MSPQSVESIHTAINDSFTSQAGSGIPFIYLFIDDIESSLQDMAIQRVLQHERRLDEEEESRRIESNGKDDVDLWHKFMQWDETFLGKDLGVRKASMISCRC